MTSELRPAVEVWRAASDAATNGSVSYKPRADQAAAAVIEADREAVRAEQAAELAKLKERLEINPEFPAYDGIACRDETIRLLDAQLAKWKALAETLAGALGRVAYSTEMSSYERHKVADKALTSYKEQHDD